MKNIGTVSLTRILKLAIPLPTIGRTVEEKTAAALRASRDGVEQQEVVDSYKLDRQKPQYASSAALSLPAGLVSIAAGVRELAEKTVLDNLGQMFTDPATDSANDLHWCVRDADALCITEVEISKKAFVFSVAAFVVGACLVGVNLPTCGLALAIAGVASASVFCKLRHAPQRAKNIIRAADTLVSRFDMDFHKDPTPEKAQKLWAVKSAMYVRPNNTQALLDVVARFTPKDSCFGQTLAQAASLVCVGEENTLSDVVRVKEARMIKGLDPYVSAALDLKSGGSLAAYFYYLRIITALESKRTLRKPADYADIIKELEEDSKGGYVDTIRQKIIDAYRADIARKNQANAAVAV